MNFMIPINFVLGACFFIVAVVYPTLDKKFLSGSEKIAAEQVVDRISRFEQRNFQLKEQYVFFAAGKMPSNMREEIGLSSLKATDFVYEVFKGDGKDSIVIRATVSDKLINEAALPPITYTYIRDPEANIAKGNWGKLSGKTVGLF
jgi:hypothetical protein